MNRKIFAALLLFPVAIFATERFVHADEGGGKDKKKPIETTTQSPQAEAQATDQEQNTDEVAQVTYQAEVSETRTAFGKTDNSAEAAKMAKALKANVDRMNEDPYSILENSAGSVRYSEDMNASLRKKLMEVLTDLQEMNPYGIDLKRSFSRCPSGYNVVVMEAEGNKFTEGAMITYRGCDTQMIAKLRFDENGKNITAEIDEKIGFIAINDFFKVLKKAAA